MIYLPTTLLLKLNPNGINFNPSDFLPVDKIYLEMSSISEIGSINDICLLLRTLKIVQPMKINNILKCMNSEMSNGFDCHPFTKHFKTVLPL
jgi:hypothetical protein